MRDDTEVSIELLDDPFLEPQATLECLRGFQLDSQDNTASYRESRAGLQEERRIQ